jgi:septum formation protein
LDGAAGTSLSPRIEAFIIGTLFGMHEFILASGSSRRHSLLNRLNQKYSICVPNIDEAVLIGEAATEYVCRMACSKALAIYQNLPSKRAVFAADTIISLNGEIIGKPVCRDQASNILHKLSENEHEVFTALYLKTQFKHFETLVRTKVKFRELTTREINRYCTTEEPYDKAGGYAIQGLAALFVDYISGSYTNVIGLPLFETWELLNQANLYNLK